MPFSSCYRFLICTCLWLASSTASLRAGAWEEANAAYAEGAYAKALTLYQDVLQRQGPSAARLYNLGNTHARLQQNGLAALCYERAALLAPRDSDLMANLNLIRPFASSSLSAPPPLWKAPLYWLSLHEWSWLATWGLLLLAASVLPWTLLSTRPAWHQKAGAALPLTGLALLLLASLALLERRAERHLAILTASNPVLRLSPFPGADPVTSFPPATGQRVIPGARHGTWVHLQIPGSETTGWLPETAITPIIP